MGRDKGLAPFLGKPLIERVVARLAHLGVDTLVITNKPADYQFLGLPLVSDKLPGRGALGGLYTALSAASQPLVALVACDMPFANPDLLAYAGSLLAGGDHAAVIPQTEHGNEPYHAVYRREACLPLVAKALEAGLWRVDSWFGEANIYYLMEPELSRLDPLGIAFLNVNTPEDLASAEQLAASAG